MSTTTFRCAVGLELLRDSNVGAKFVETGTCGLLGMLLAEINLCESAICEHKCSSALCDRLRPGWHPIKVPFTCESRGMKIKVVYPVSPVDGVGHYSDSFLCCGFEHLLCLIKTNIHGPCQVLWSYV